MYLANVYNIMIGAPSDIKDEVRIACQAINRWNNVHSEINKMVLLPLHWSFSSYPSSGCHPQKSINKQIVDKSDLMLCFFGTRIGSPTDTEISGTVEEMKEHIKAGKTVMIFFRTSIDNITDIDLEQLKRIKDFREDIKDSVMWWEYSSIETLSPILYEKLEQFVNDNWAQANQLKENKKTMMEFSDYDIERLVKWTNSENNMGYCILTSDGVSYELGDDEYSVENGREEAEFDDFLERLAQIDFAECTEYSDYSRSYKLKKAAYEYVDKIGK